ncbi:hypothetical protein EV421DRAFT_1741076 [Armillaria borealis]|uniref:Uncharacterized protein n=1 Tax=Armillaria borealis TaxID=47425 RepID=A0AA39MI25_9AGAR|nr:hypothetical protein EV421DRAFT_1741076 [Armillaria borealis]
MRSCKCEVGMLQFISSNATYVVKLCPPDGKVPRRDLRSSDACLRLKRPKCLVKRKSPDKMFRYTPVLVKAASTISLIIVYPTVICRYVYRRDAVVVLAHDRQELRLRLDDSISATVKGSIKIEGRKAPHTFKISTTDHQASRHAKKERESEGNYTRNRHGGRSRVKSWVTVLRALDPDRKVIGSAEVQMQVVIDDGRKRTVTAIYTLNCRNTSRVSWSDKKPGFVKDKTEYNSQDYWEIVRTFKILEKGRTSNPGQYNRKAFLLPWDQGIKQACAEQSHTEYWLRESTREPRMSRGGQKRRLIESLASTSSVGLGRSKATEGGRYVYGQSIRTRKIARGEAGCCMKYRAGHIWVHGNVGCGALPGDEEEHDEGGEERGVWGVVQKCAPFILVEVARANDTGAVTMSS